MAVKRANRAAPAKKAPVKPPRATKTPPKRLPPVAQHLKDLQDAAAATKRRRR